MPRSPTPQPSAPARTPVPSGAAVRWWPTWVAACLGALLCAVVQAPARWLADAVTRASGGQLQLINARGTVWNGQAHALFSGGSGSQDRALLPTPLRWQLAPTWLTAGQAGAAAPTTATPTARATPNPPASTTTGPALAITLATDCCTPQDLHLWIQPRWRGLALTVAEHRSSWPAALLTGLGTPWNTLQLQAQLQLSTPGVSLQWGANGLRGSGTATLDVLDAASRLSTLRPMGSYRLQWQAGGPAALASTSTPTAPGANASSTTALSASPTLALTTLHGALLLQGQGEWVAGRLRFSGDAQASPGREDALANLLNILGRRQGARSLITLG